MLKRMFALVALLFLVTGCAVTPQEELQLGLDSHAGFEKDGGGKFADATVQAYVSKVGMEMAARANRPDMNWQFAVLNSADINAFAVPGGYIYITQGLLFRMQNEAQLAGVLGHEAGHIAYRHSAKSIERSRYISMATAGLGAIAEQAGYAIAGNATSAAAQLYLLKYSRDHEIEADYAGLKYMTASGYNPKGMVELMKILQAASGGGGSGALGEWTATHPDPGNRVEYLTAAIQKDYAGPARTGKVGADEFKANVGSRRPRSAGLPLSSPVAWCGMCRENQKGSAVAVSAGTELLEVTR